MQKAQKSGAAVGKPTGLGELLALGLKSQGKCATEDLQAVFVSQISVPVEYHLGAMKSAEIHLIRNRAASHGLLLKSIHDLYHHPHPPIELLVMAKDFFKANSASPTPGLPAEVSRALYYLAVASAFLRHHAYISTLSTTQLLGAFEWVSRQSWVDKDMQSLASDAARSLKSDPGISNKGTRE